MAIQATQLAELVALTQRDLGRARFTEIATDVQEFTALPNLLNKNRVVLTGGFGVQWNIMVNHNGAAANVGMGSPDNPVIVDTMVNATADWRHSTTNYAVEARMVDMNREPARIVEYVRTQRIAGMIAMAELMENNFWGPPVALADDLTPWGINTWLVKNATEGHSGGAPSGYTSIGLNPTTYPRWKNYTAQYTNVTKDDFVRKARRASRFTNFKPPVNGIPTYSKGGSQYGYYTNNSVLGIMEEILEAQNDNLGNDVASKDNMVMFRRGAVNWVPKLEADTTNPFYGLNWSDFETHVLSGWWLRETNVPVYPGQHTMSVTFYDCTYQHVMKNRRTSFVMATGTTYPS